MTLSIRKFLNIKPKFCVFHIDRYRVHCQSLWHTDYYLVQKHSCEGLEWKSCTIIGVNAYC